MKNILLLSILLSAGVVVGCSEKPVEKNYEYFLNNIDDARKTARNCLKNKISSNECDNAKKAAIDWQNKTVENQTRAIAWD